MKRREQDELLKELLSGSEVSDFRQASLQGGLGAIRRRNLQRRVMRTGVMVLLPALLVAGVLIYRSKETMARQMALVRPQPGQVSTPQAKTAAVKIISDEDLFALFPGRAMALIGKPGEQRLVFLDGGSALAKVR
jgi:hypothetical protein